MLLPIAAADAIRLPARSGVFSTIGILIFMVIVKLTPV
jgi:hypothetical protein